MDQLADRFAAQSGDFQQALTHQDAQVRARHFVDQRRCEGGHVRLAFEGARVGFFGQLLEEIVRQRLRMLVDARAEGVGAFGADQGVRVFAFGQEQKACAASVQGRHGIAQALLGEGDHVHIAFNHDDFVEVAVVLARFEQAVEFLALVKHRGFG